MSSPDLPLRKPAIILLGAPGSGKGTIGKTLGTIPRFFHFSCGDVFRALDTRTPLGQQFLAYSSRGELVPDEFTVQLMRAQLSHLVEMRTYKPDIDILVLDGVPRNLSQARLLDDHLDFIHIFHLSCPDRTELTRRIRKRALKDGRVDDASEAVIRRRFETYDEDTKPILAHYDDSLITEIDAMQPPLLVLSAIASRIATLTAFIRMASIQA